MGGEEICIQGIGNGDVKGKRPLVRSRRRWKIILKWTFRKWNLGTWTGSGWLTIGKGGGLL